MGESVGIDTVRLSRDVFVIAALYAAVAGFLFAHFQRFISPTPFGLGASIDYLFMVIIGGSDSLWGAPLGATLVVVLRDQFNDWIPRLTGRAGDFEALVFSLVVIVLLQRAPAGLLPLLARLKPRGPGVDEAHPSPVVVRLDPDIGQRSHGRASDPTEPAPLPGAPVMARLDRDIGRSSHGVASDPARPSRTAAAELLSLQSVSRNFAGLAAVRDVAFTVHADEIVALIGPNGAGKTTLFNLISGVLPPSSGHIALFGAPAENLPPRRVAALGVARTFQHVKLLPTRSVLENIALGAHLLGRSGLMRAMLRLDRTEEAALLAEAHSRPSAWVSAMCSPCRPAICLWGSSASWRSRAPCVCARACCCWTSPPPDCDCPRNDCSRTCCASFAPRAWACCWWSTTWTS